MTTRFYHQQLTARRRSRRDGFMIQIVSPPSLPPNFIASSLLFDSFQVTLYELNIQSVITSPSHGTRVTLGDSLQHPTLVEGYTPFNMQLQLPNMTQISLFLRYAYSGGGRKITRVEVSLDGGRRWGLAQIIYPHNTPRHDCK